MKVNAEQHPKPSPSAPTKGSSILFYPGKVSEAAFLRQAKATPLRPVRHHGKPSGWKNMLAAGDNLGILKSFLGNPEIAGRVDLVYIDPPFGTGQDFVGYDEATSYSDRLVDSEFLEFLRQRLILLRELMSDQASIYLHIDQKIGHYVKILMDEVFGIENFRNDITRIKCNPKNFDRKAYGNTKDVIYFYSKRKPNGSDSMIWNDHRLPLSEDEIIRQFPRVDSSGRRYATTPLHAKGETKDGPTGRPWKGLLPPKGRHWRYSPVVLEELDQQGLVEWSATGNPRKIIYADKSQGKKAQDIWDYRDPGYERSRYPTEKNLKLLEHIILNSSREGDLVLDCFAGSGTTLVAAEKLNRRWIGIDANTAAIEVAERRLLELPRSLLSERHGLTLYG